MQEFSEEEKEEGFEKTDEKNVEGETEDAAVPALAGRVGLSCLLFLLVLLVLLFLLFLLVLLFKSR